MTTLFAVWALSGCDVVRGVVGGQSAQDVADSTPRGEIHRFRYVVEVDTPQGVVEGHSVIGMRVDCGHGLNGKTCGTSEVSEAAVVPLPDGRNLYSLLTNQSEPQWICCGPAMAWKDGKSSAYKEYKPDMYPDLVMFNDERDPKSVHVIDGTKPFDKGYTIRRIYVAATQEPLTSTIIRRLPWLKGMQGRLNGDDAGSYSGPEGGRFSRYCFIKKN